MITIMCMCECQLTTRVAVRIPRSAIGNFRDELEIGFCQSQKTALMVAIKPITAIVQPEQKA